MKWGRNKSAIPHVFPGSWFCKSKQKDGNSDKHLEFSTPKSKQGRSFRSMDDPDHGRRIQEFASFNGMVSDINKMRGKQRIVEEKPRKSRGFDDEEEEEKISNLQERLEIKIKSESKKKSVKSYSPRAECKIRALEDKKKKSRSKTKTKEREQVFDSFAIVKSSYNPEEDFRESMMEMITEGGIESAEDLQQLLASYLTLNCDEHHDLIFKVFRQVCLELKEAYIGHRVYSF